MCPHLQCATTASRCGEQARHAGYPYQEEAAHSQPDTDRNTPSTPPGWLVPPDPAGAVCAPTECALLCPPRDPTAPWTPSRACRLPVPGGSSPPPAGNGPQHAFNRIRVACAGWGLPDVVGTVECALLCPPHDPTAPWTPSSTCRLSASGRRQPTASPTRTATRPRPHQGGWCRLTLQASPLSVHCCALPATPPRHRHQAGHAGYLCQEEAAHR